MPSDLGWKYLGIGLYFLALLVIGAVATRRSHGLRGFFAADKQLGLLPASFSARATGESAWLLLGLTGLGALVGVKAFWVVIGELIGVGGAWLLMAGRFKRLTDHYDAITIPDFLESRLRDRTASLRLLSAAVLVVFVTVYVSAQLDATGLAFEAFLGWDRRLGALVGFLVVVFYSTAGGFVAVAWSDVLQGLMMVTALVALPVLALWELGGVTHLSVLLAAADPNLLHPLGDVHWDSLDTLRCMAYVLLGLGFWGAPQVFVRFIALRDVQMVPRGAAIALLWTLLADGGAVITGMAARALLVSPQQTAIEVFGTGAEEALPVLVTHLMPAPLVGLLIAVVLAAIMSTVDSLLVLAGSAIARDVVQKVYRPSLREEDLTGLARGSTVGMALLGALVAITFAQLGTERTVFWFVVFGWSGIAAVFCPVTLLSLFWVGLTRNGAVVGMVVGFVAVPLFRFVLPHAPGIGPAVEALTELPPAMACSLAAAVATSLLDLHGQRRLLAAGADTDLDRIASGRPTPFP